MTTPLSAPSFPTMPADKSPDGKRRNTLVRVRDAAQSRADILAAAEACFAEKGFYGASMNDIAALAGINKRMLYAYFDNKENLYKQVLFTVYQRMEQVEVELLKSDPQGVALIVAIITAYFDFLQHNHTFVSIVMRENLSQASYLNELPLDQVKRKTLSIFRDRIVQGIQQGIFKKNVDADQVVLSLIVVCFANFSNRYTLSRLFTRNMEEEEILEARKQHTINLVLAYLCP